MLPIEQETLLSDLKLARRVLTKWVKRVQEGIPGVDSPEGSDSTDAFFTALCGELLLVSGKCENISNVLSGNS